MRFHVVGLPYTPTHPDSSSCAFTIKNLNFCRMMHARGHEVFHYGLEGSQVSCTENIDVMSKETHQIFFPPRRPNEFFKVDWTGSAGYWKHFNTSATNQIRQRLKLSDFICIIGGTPNKPIADQLSNQAFVVEYGIGHNGPFAGYRVYESYAHMHKMWAIAGGVDPDGKFYDAVIPGYLDPNEFTYQPSPDDYFLYIGRMIHRKGLCIAVDVCNKIGAKLKLAGQGVTKVEGSKIICEDGCTYEGNCLEYVGEVTGKTRVKLFQNAKATFVPTLYIEPFGAVAIESQMCGTPVICTDFGAFSETVEHGQTGFRCRTLDHFIFAARNISELSREYTRRRAVANYSLDRVSLMYEEYFSMLLDLSKEGWNALHPERSNLDWLRTW